MITPRFSQGAKYLQLERQQDVESVCVARIHRQSKSIALNLWDGGDRYGKQ